MQDTDLDTFPGEDETTTSKRIVITDDQLRSSWETFPTEQTGQVESKPAEPTDDPLANMTLMPPPAPDEPIAQPVVKRRSSFAPAVLIALLALGLLAGPEIKRRLAAPVPVQPSAPIQLPASAATAAASEASNTDATVPAAAAIEPADDANAASQPAPDVATIRTPAPVNPLPPASVPRAIAAARRTVAAPPRIAQPSSAPATPAAVTAPSTAAVITPSTAAATTLPAEPAATAAPAVPAAPAIATPPAAPSAAPPASAPAAAAAAAPVLAPETRAVLGALYRYQEAFSTLDSNAAQQVWPDVDVRALDRAFDQLAQQTFDLRSCDVGVSGERAEAVCTGTASYTRKVGNKAMRVEARRWRFALRRDGSEWLIQGVDVR